MALDFNAHIGAESELDSAFSNLVNNAVRYSPNGGHITVQWHRSPSGPRFEVRDQGVGIPAEHLSRITERFYRVDLSRDRVRGGTGLGLAIVKHVLKRHETALDVESVVGEGSAFHCTFPSRRGRSIAKGPRRRVMDAGRSPSVQRFSRQRRRRISPLCAGVPKASHRTGKAADTSHFTRISP
jgi:hypothetical protein